MAEMVISVAAGADDGDAYASTMNTGATTLFFGFGGSGNQIAFMRFVLPSALTGATISETTFDGIFQEALGTTVGIRAIDSSNPTAPASWADLTGRPVTTATVEWNPNPTGGGGLRTSPNFASVIQELVDSYSMGSGDHLWLLLDPRDKTTSYVNEIASFEHATNAAPEITITYTEAAPTGDYGKIIDMGARQFIKVVR